MIQETKILGIAHIPHCALGLLIKLQCPLLISGAEPAVGKSEVWTSANRGVGDTADFAEVCSAVYSCGRGVRIQPEVEGEWCVSGARAGGGRGLGKVPLLV